MEFPGMISRDLAVKAAFEPTIEQRASRAKIQSWNILGNQITKGSEMSEGRKEGRSHWDSVNQGVEVREKGERQGTNQGGP